MLPVGFDEATDIVLASQLLREADGLVSEHNICGNNARYLWLVVDEHPSFDPLLPLRAEKQKWSSKGDGLKKVAEGGFFVAVCKDGLSVVVREGGSHTQGFNPQVALGGDDPTSKHVASNSHLQEGGLVVLGRVWSGCVFPLCAPSYLVEEPLVWFPPSGM